MIGELSISVRIMSFAIHAKIAENANKYKLLVSIKNVIGSKRTPGSSILTQKEWSVFGPSYPSSRGPSYPTLTFYQSIV